MLLPTSVVGSHGLPGWVWLAREAMEAGRLGATDVRELMEDATQAALLDQERAGIDVVTTGEMMRVRFIIGFYDRITGIRRLAPPRKLGQPLWDTNTPFDVVERIGGARRPRDRRGVEARAIAHHETAQSDRARPVHAARPAEARRRLQGQGDAACRPRRDRQRRVPRARRGRLRLHPDRRAPEQSVAPDKLWLNPDCGFWETPRWIVRQKLTALVEGARTVRKELGG